MWQRDEVYGGFVVQALPPSFRHFTLERYFSNLANLSARSADVSPHFPPICSFLTRTPFSRPLLPLSPLFIVSQVNDFTLGAATRLNRLKSP